MSTQYDFNFDAVEMILPDSKPVTIPPKNQGQLFVHLHLCICYYYFQGYRQRPANGGQKLMLQGPLEQVVTIC